MLDKHPLIRSMKALTVAIWCLCVVVAAELVLAIWSQVQMHSWRSATRYSESQTPIAHSRTPEFGSPDDFNNFSALPLDQKLQRASVIVVTRFKREGDSLKAIITDIPKRRAGTTFFYSVGQEFTDASTYQQPGCEYGDGVVVFLVDNPARMVESYSYSHDRIGGLGSMPLAQFRDSAGKSK